jgi:hypothetical protein
MLSTFALALALKHPADYRSQYPLPSLTVPSGWGVNIHFANPKPGEVEKIAAAGFRWIRYDFYWDQIEKRRGQYDFSNYDILMAALLRNRIRPMFILDYGNDLYERGAPSTPSTRAAFARFVSAAVRHYRRQGVVWEMWNEPNIHFWKPEPNVDDYIALAAEVGRTIRSVAPDEWYVGPATSEFDWAFLNRCFDAGLLRYWDAVTVHPYRRGGPESAAPEWVRLRSTIAAKAGGRPIRVFAGEWGYSEKDQRASLQEQGWYAARMYLTNLAAGVPMTILYDWRDGSPLGDDSVAHFGSVDAAMRPKPAYVAVRHLAHALGGYTYRGRVQLRSPEDYLLLFRKGSAVKIVGYSTRGSVTIPLPVGDAPVQVSAPSLTKSLGKGQGKRGVVLTAEPRVFTPSGTNDVLRRLGG